MSYYKVVWGLSWMIGCFALALEPIPAIGLRVMQLIVGVVLLLGVMIEVGMFK